MKPAFTKTTLFIIFGAVLSFVALTYRPISAIAQVASLPGQTRIKETLACASPCTVNGANVVVFNARSLVPPVAGMRVYLTMRNTGANDVFCCWHASVCTTTTYDVLLFTASKDAFTQYGPVVWSGGITCASAAATSVTAFSFVAR